MSLYYCEHDIYNSRKAKQIEGRVGNNFVSISLVTAICTMSCSTTYNYMYRYAPFYSECIVYCDLRHLS
jgi:hypothetical protein